MDCIVQGVTKSQSQLSNFHFHSTPKTSPNILCPNCDNSILLAVQAKSLGVIFTLVFLSKFTSHCQQILLGLLSSYI